MDTTIKAKAPRQGKKNQNTAKSNKSVRQPSSFPKGGMSKSLSVPVAVGRVKHASKPVFRGLPNGDIIVSHREFIQDIAGSVGFGTTTLRINPGIAATFPWLSVIAQRYESYLFEDLVFEFETQAPTSATGTVLITLDYDASEAAPTDKTSALAYRSSVRSPPWADCTHISLLEDLNKQRSYFVRDSALGSNQDIKLYDVATGYVSTQGQASTAAVGELYVRYKVRLMTPQLGASAATAYGGAYSGSTNAAPFGTTVAGNLPATVASTGTTSSVTTFTFTSAWKGYFGMLMTGTTFSGQAIGGTCTKSDLSHVWGATNFYQLADITAAAGETFTISCTNATISLVYATFGEHP